MFFSSIERFMADAKNWLDSVPNELELERILMEKQIQIVDAPVVTESMLRSVRPVAYDGARPIVRRPALERYLQKS